MFPFNEKFSVFDRVGLTNAETKDSFSGTGLVNAQNSNPGKSDTNYKLGLGRQYHFTKSLGMRAELERCRINDVVGNKGDIDLVSIGLVYRFGGASE